MIKQPSRAHSLLFATFTSHTTARILAALVILVAISKPIFAADTYCSDLTAVSATSGWSTVQKDMSIDKKPITLGGKVYPKGLGTHSPSEIVYNLNGKYALFAADVGIDDQTAGKGSVEFLVYADDSLLFKSGVLRGKMAPAEISVSVAGKNKLKLVVTIGPDTYDMDDADWAGALLVEKATVALQPHPEASPAVQSPALPAKAGLPAIDARNARPSVDARGREAQGDPPRQGSAPRWFLRRPVNF